MIISATRYGSSSGGGSGGTTVKYEVISGAPPTYLEDAETGNWELVFLSSALIKFSTVPSSIEVFAVGGGASGLIVGSDSGGAGGKGGACVTDTRDVSAGVEYQVDIGAGGQSTSAFGVTAASGGGANGGPGATASANAGAGSDGSLAFGSGGTLYENGTPIKFGAGGGGGGRNTSNSGTKNGASGGASGGGDGAYYYWSSGSLKYSTENKDGKANTGGGGGGGGVWIDPGYGLSPGLGGSGIVIVRNSRAS